jgi:hypothetical protein
VSAPPGAGAVEGRPSSPNSKVETRACESCLERDHGPRGALPNVLSAATGMPVWNEVYGFSRAIGCVQCGGSGRVPAKSAPYADLPAGAKPVWDQPMVPRRRFPKYVPEPADFDRVKTKRQEIFVTSLWRGVSFETACDDADISERMGYKILAQLREMSHSVQVEPSKVPEGLNARERTWLLDIAEFKDGRPLAKHWHMEYAAARQRKSRLLRKVKAAEQERIVMNTVREAIEEIREDFYHGRLCEDLALDKLNALAERFPDHPGANRAINAFITETFRDST